jgi:hypothetical protein
MKHLILFTVNVLAMAGSAAYADDIVHSDETSLWLWSISGGAVGWGNLGNIESMSGGGFDDVGFGVELSGHMRLAKCGKADVLVGVDLGVFTIDSDIQGVYNDLAQRGLYLTPSVKLGFGERSQYFLEAGAGWYNTDFAELSCTGIYYYYCEELAAPFYSDTVGAYLGFRAGLGKIAFISVRAHHADFGRITGVDSAATNLTGPFYSLLVGAGF